MRQFTPPEFADEFAKRIGSPLPDGSLVCDRLLYGSDFYMNQISGATRMFAREMERYLTAALSGAGPVQRVMGANAVRFYGLDNRSTSGKSTGSRARTERFFRNHGITAPDWFTSL